MNDQIASIIKQRGKNLTLLVICGTLVSMFHPEVAAAVMAGVCTAVGASFVAENWAGKTSEETEA